MIDIKIMPSKDFEKIRKKKYLKYALAFTKLVLEDVLLDYWSQWPGFAMISQQKLTLGIAKKIFESEDENELFKVLLKGTSFEARVWKALTKIPKGKTVSYQDVALMIGHNKAIRAAANAVAKNSVAYLIPCHRVIRKNGSLHKYQWGSHIKQKILNFENCYW